MGTYKPLFMYVAPASIPQIVAHIQKYLEENPIISDPEAIAAVISDYIEEHPELIAVASVNGKTGAVVLTGSDININATTEVTIATQIANLAAMIADAGGDIDTINDNIEDIYTELDGTEGIKARLTAVETDINDATNGIKVRLSGIEGEVNGTGGIDSRLTTVENDINASQTGIKARLTDVETDVLSLQTRMTQAETDIDNSETAINTNAEAITNIRSTLTQIQSDITDLNSYSQTTIQNLNYTLSNNVVAKKGNIVTVTFRLIKPSGGSETLGYVPEGYRPPFDIILRSPSNEATGCPFIIRTTGEILTSTTPTGDVRCAVTYITN